MFRASYQKRLGVFEATYETHCGDVFWTKTTPYGFRSPLHPLSFLVGWTPPYNEIPPRGVRRLRRLTTPLRALRIRGTFALLKHRVCLPLVSCRPAPGEKARIGVYASSALFLVRDSLHFRVAAVPPSGEPCTTLRGVVSRLAFGSRPDAARMTRIERFASCHSP